MRCSECDTMIPEDSVFCPECGAEVTSAPSRPRPSAATLPPVKQRLIPANWTAWEWKTPTMAHRLFIIGLILGMIGFIFGILGKTRGLAILGLGIILIGAAHYILMVSHDLARGKEV